MIDSYLRRRFRDASGEPVVGQSRVELNGSVYCAVLSTLQVNQTFLREPFNLFKNSGINPSRPQYLYLLNSAGIPLPHSVTGPLRLPIPIPLCSANWTASQYNART